MIPVEFRMQFLGVVNFRDEGLRAAVAQEKNAAPAIVRQLARAFRAYELSRGLWPDGARPR